MYPDTYLPKPLRTAEFYIMLALVDEPLHAYGVKGAVANASLGAVLLKDGNLYPMLARMCAQGWIDMISHSPAGKSGKQRLHYLVSEHGRIRLQEELQRLRHAVRVLENSGIGENPMPTDIQRLLVYNKAKERM